MIGEAMTWAATRAILGLGLLLAASGCAPAPAADRDQKMIEQCEDFIKGKLVAPSTYKRISVTVGIPDEATGRQTVFINYDANNSYNTPIRGLEQCDFPYGPEERKIRPLTDIERKVLADSRAEDARRNAELGIEPTDPECCMPARPAALPTRPVQAVKESAAAAPLDNEAEPMDGLTEEATADTPQSLCWQDYCPCDPPQGGMDEMLCRRLRAGLPVDDEMMSAGAGFRDAREQMDELESGSE